MVPKGQNNTARGETPGKWPFIYPVLKGRNKYAVITPFQGWSNRLTSSQGFHPWLFYLRAFGAPEEKHFLKCFSIHI